MTEKYKIYFGAPLFSESEQLYNEYVVGKIRERFGDKVDVYNPMENEAINDKSKYADSQMISRGDNEYLKDSDVLIAVLDGVAVDAGLAAEVGFFYSTGRPIIGVYTDSRQGTYGNKDKIDALEVIGENQMAYLNLYLVGVIKDRGKLVRSSEELLDVLGDLINDK